MSEPDSNHGSIAGDDSRATRIENIVFDVLQRRLAGESVSDEQLVAQHSDLMPELGEELRIAKELRSGRNSVATATSISSRQSSGPLTIRCPHCRQPMEWAADSSTSSIQCSRCGSHFSLSPDVPESLEGLLQQQLGHFQLLERLGAGSFGTVWKALDTELDRKVAVKIPRRGELSTSEVDFFLREARTAAQLNHPHIIAVHEIGRIEDTVFIVSDYVHGQELLPWAQQTQPTFQEVAKICSEIAEALQHAHDQGVIHRDLKPQNIIVDDADEPHLMDFGLARRDAGETTVTIDGHVLGTPAYMSPEQARGDSHRADHRSDIYSLGAILFELLTGELPFRGNSRMIIHQLLENDVESPRNLNRSIPKDLETICLKCLQKEPSKRYSSAQDVADELQRTLRGETIRARPISRTERAWRWCRRKPITAALLALLICVAIGGPLVAINQARLRHDANRRLVEANINRAVNLAGSGQSGQRLEGLAAIAESVPLAKALRLDEQFTLRMRNAAIACMAQGDLTVVKEWDLQTGTVFHADFDHALQYYAIHAHPGDPIRVVRIKDDQEVARFPVSGIVEGIRLSHDGRFLACVTDFTTLNVWEVSSKTKVSKFEINNPLTGYDLGNETNSVALALEDGRIQIVDLSSLQVRHEFPQGAEVYCLSFGPQDQRMAVGRVADPDHGDESSQVKLYELGESNHLLRTWPLPRPPLAVTMGPNNLLAVVDDSNRVVVLDAGLGNRISTFRPPFGGTLAEFDESEGMLIVGNPQEPWMTVWNARTGTSVLRLDATFIGYRDGHVAVREPGRLGLARLIPSDTNLGISQVTEAPFWGSIHAETSLLVMPGYRDLKVWDLNERRLLAAVPKYHKSALFVSGGDTLYTVSSHGVNGERHLHRWPLGETDEKRNAWTLGPPQHVPLPDEFQPHHLASDAAGTILVATDDRRGPEGQYGRILILDLQSDQAPHILDEPYAMFVDVSPNGRWLATGTWRNKSVSLYDLRTKKRVREFPVGRTQVAFSPDSRYLLYGTGMRIDLKSWSDASFADVHQLQFEAPLFMNSGRVGVFNKRTSDASLLLFDTQGWKLLGELSASTQSAILNGRAVTPNGTRIVVQVTRGGDDRFLELWDLHAIREQFDRLGLDWNLPPLPQPQQTRLPVKLTVDVGTLLEE